MSFLDRIIAARQTAIRELRMKTPLSVLEESPYWDEKRRPFSDALRRSADTGGATGPIRFLAEIKRASPSAGPIRPDADVTGIARDYADAGAAALSILTEEMHFDGNPAFLGLARGASGLPLLQKDFIFDEWQVLWARSLGADAILLILAALDRVQARDLVAVGRENGLAILVETHNEAEVDRALEIGADIIGINHRDLGTLDVDPSLSERLLPRIPSDSRVVRVAESGVRSREDVLRLERLGFDALLIGERLMRAPSPGAALRSLRGVE